MLFNTNWISKSFFSEPGRFQFLYADLGDRRIMLIKIIQIL
jgi:hypothetical protein